MVRRLLCWSLACALAGCQCHPSVVPLPDGGADAGRADAGLGDAGLPFDAGTPDAGTRDAGVPLCDALLDATCRWYLRCGQLDAPQLADCRALLAWTCTQAQVDALLGAGKISFAAAQLPACLTGLEEASCNASQPASPACDLFAPATQVGGSCTRQWSTVCSGGYCHGTSCPAACVDWLPLDASCTGTEGDECGPDAWCDFSSRVCVPILTDGAPCSPNQRCRAGTCDGVQQRCVLYGSLGADAGCTTDAVCGDGLYCDAQACRPREQLGGPCRLYGGLDCDEPFTCRLYDGGTTGTCAARSSEGGPCFGLPADCEPGLLCDSPMLFAAGACVSLRSVDAPCDRALDNCRLGLTCDAVTQRCRTLPRVGEPCVRDPGNFRSSDCSDGFCPADAGVCLAPQGAGAPCERPWECGSGECDDGMCAALCTAL